GIGETWKALNSGTNNDLNDLYFVNSKTGFAIGNNSTLIKTINQGKSWTAIPLEFGLRNYNSIYAFDENNIIIIGEMGSVFITNDGGLGWYNADLPNYEISFNHIIFYNNTHGIIAADNGLILISTDAGITWQPSVTNLNENGNDLYSVAFTDDKTGISAG